MRPGIVERHTFFQVHAGKRHLPKSEQGLSQLPAATMPAMSAWRSVRSAGSGVNRRNETYLLVLWRTVLQGSRGKQPALRSYLVLHYY